MVDFPGLDDIEHIDWYKGDQVRSGLHENPVS